MNQSDEIILQHQLEEWKYLNEYINKMDTGYQQTFVLLVALFTGIIMYISKDVNLIISYVIFLIPLGIISILAYVSYQFRITAILRGHLAVLEEDMNETIGKDVHLWNSALVETFMAHNNLINSMMMISIMTFIVALTVYCMYFSNRVMMHNDFGNIIWIAYWIVIAILAAIVLLPFMKNEDVRIATYNENTVLNEYKKYRENRKSKFKYSIVKNKKQFK